MKEDHINENGTDMLSRDEVTVSTTFNHFQLSQTPFLPKKIGIPGAKQEE